MSRDQQLEQPLVDEELVVVERLVGVDLVLVEQVVADRGLANRSACLQRHLLAVAGEQAEQLRLERGAGAAACSSPSNGLSISSRTSAASSRLASRSASAVLPTPAGPSIAM